MTASTVPHTRPTLTSLTLARDTARRAYAMARRSGITSATLAPLKAARDDAELALGLARFLRHR